MGYFKEQELKRVALSDPSYWVDIVPDLQWKDLKKFASLGDDGNLEFSSRGDLFLSTVIQAWNLDNEAGEIVPINSDNIDLLKKDDILLIINEAGGLVESDQAKKALPNLSSPSSAEGS